MTTDSEDIYLITGGYGFIGSSLIRILLKKEKINVILTSSHIHQTLML